MTACPQNIWNHTNGCSCTASGETTGEALDVDLTTPARSRPWRSQRLMVDGHPVNTVPRAAAEGTLRPGWEFGRAAKTPNGWSEEDTVTIPWDWTDQDYIPVDHDNTSGQHSVYDETEFAVDPHSGDLIVFHDGDPILKFRRSKPVTKTRK
jgi:hypothetical protein